jgi:hypothetical protein
MTSGIEWSEHTQHGLSPASSPHTLAGSERHHINNGRKVLWILKRRFYC